MSDQDQRSNPTVTLRPVVSEDEPFLFELYASTRAEEMATVPWTREQQDLFVRMQFEAQLAHYKKTQPDASHDIIMSDGRPVGRLYVARPPDRIEIMDITVLPQERNKGIGSSLIKGLMSEAESSRPLRIYTENFNPSVRLLERLGFKTAQEDGFLLLMEWVPNSPPPPSS